MNTPSLTVVVPVYNEEQTIETLMRRLTKACGQFSQIIYVNDGSVDNSLVLLEKYAQPQDMILSKENGGKGSAVRMGFGHAKGKYVIVQDADLEYDPEEIPTLLAFAEKHNYPVVFGSRRMKHQKQFTHFAAFVGGTLLTYIGNILFGLRLTDQPTCYKLIRRDILQSLPLKSTDFRFEPEVTAHLAVRKIPIREYPISYHPRRWDEGKKIGLKDWFLWVWEFIRLRVTLPRSHPPTQR